MKEPVTSKDIQSISNYYDSKAKPRFFKVGDWVLKKRLLCDRVPSEGTLSLNWDEPFEVVGISRPGSYKLRSSDGKTFGHPWKADHLKVLLQVNSHCTSVKLQSFGILCNEDYLA
ncbi:hypothetical protein ACFX1R_031764 [Malus domestica]